MFYLFSHNQQTCDLIAINKQYFLVILIRFETIQYIQFTNKIRNSYRTKTKRNNLVDMIFVHTENPFKYAIEIMQIKNN